MTTAKELCLAIAEYFINFGNKRFLPLVPSPPTKVICKYLNFSKRRNNDPKIMKIASKFKDTRNVFPFNKRDFLNLRGHVT